MTRREAKNQFCADEQLRDQKTLTFQDSEATRYSKGKLRVREGGI